jgi:hypothetical protein
MENTTNVEYWTPQGLTSGEPPPTWTAVCATKKTDSDLNENGYGKLVEIGKDYDLIHIWVWEHADGHLWINTGSEGYHQHLFVKPEHASAFLFNEVPKLTSIWVQAETASQLQKIAKTLIAFVRHGHGEETISEDGDYSLDDSQSHPNK